MQRKLTIALVGNPNSGKSSLFNALTGLNQKVGNFPGVTVDKKTGNARLSDSLSANIIDLPGTYSLYPKSADEQVTYDVLLNQQSADRPDIIVVIADAANLKRNLLFCTQIMDLKIPVVIALTMMDIASRKGIKINVESMEQMMAVPIIPINPRKNRGLGQLKHALASIAANGQETLSDFVDLKAITGEWLDDIREIAGQGSAYAALHIACNYTELKHLNAAQRIGIAAILGENKFAKAKMQAEEIMQRYTRINRVMQKCVSETSPSEKIIASDKIDKTLLHPVWGNVILLAVLFILFQSIFWLARYPMDWIQQAFALGGSAVGAAMPDGLLKDLVVNGLFAGVSGIMIFVPQIMILFGFITILEDSGYMARISFLTDRIMRSAGLNGRSVMPLISGMACAVPAIMAARTIQNARERLITIMVTPLMSCSARLPVYTMLIALVIPEEFVLGIFNLQGLVLMGLYLLGFFMALIVAKVMSWIIKAKERTYFLMELPVYRAPRWKNVGITMIEKGKIFVRDVGKVIIVLSLILWFLAYFGPPKAMDEVAVRYAKMITEHPEQKVELEHEMASAKLEHSFAGIMGKSIEPIIRPLGYDWKIGIALITSFAAREVFVGTMATLYSVGDTDSGTRTLEQKMREAKRDDGSPVYTLAAGLSLLIFYVFAMQCMSTLAIVKRETRSWKYPAIQFVYMFGLAYLCAFVVFQLFKQ